MPLHIETHHEDRTIVLSCETCAVDVDIRTLDPDFLRQVEAFFEAHTDCKQSVDLTA